MPSWHEPNRRPWPLILGLIAGALIALTIAAGQAYGATRLPAAETTAGGYTNRPVQVRCNGTTEWTRPEVAGYVTWTRAADTDPWVPGDIDLGPHACYGLLLLMVGSDWRIDLQGYALMVFAHEIAHAAGTFNEHDADCRALPWIEPLAISLGANGRVLPRILVEARFTQARGYGGACG